MMLLSKCSAVFHLYVKSFNHQNVAKLEKMFSLHIKESIKSTKKVSCLVVLNRLTGNKWNENGRKTAKKGENVMSKNNKLHFNVTG